MSKITKQKAFDWKKGQGRDALDGFSHLAYAGVRESVRTRDMAYRHSYRDMHVLYECARMCVNLWHCKCT